MLNKYLKEEEYMELYKEKLENFKKGERSLKKVQESLEKVQETLEKVRKDLEEYVKENIVSGEYTIGSKKLEDGYELFYPVLSLPEGIKMQSETFWCYYEEEYRIDWAVHNYILLDEKENIEINVTEKSIRRKLEYNDNLGNCLRIKNKINVMEGDIYYDIKIEEMEFQCTRNFSYEIEKSFLINLLKDKYVCYKDFKETPTYHRTNFTGRHCVNKQLEEGKIDWKNNLRNFRYSMNILNGFFTYCDFEKVISDIEQILIQGEYKKNPITKLYYLKEGYTLIVSVAEKDNDHNCIYYEDELMILELNTPLNKQTDVEFWYAEQSYEKNLDIHNLKRKWIDTLMLEKKEIDMEKTISVLEIFNLK